MNEADSPDTLACAAKQREQFETDHVTAFSNVSNDRFMLSAIKNAGGLAIASDSAKDASSTR